MEPELWETLVNFLMTLAPWVKYVFIGLGSLAVAGTAIDAAVPDEKDKGFMKKIMKIPVLGGFLEFIKRFSPFNIKK